MMCHLHSVGCSQKAVRWHRDIPLCEEHYHAGLLLLLKAAAVGYAGHEAKLLTRRGKAVADDGSPWQQNALRDWEDAQQ